MPVTSSPRPKKISDQWVASWLKRQGKGFTSPSLRAQAEIEYDELKRSTGNSLLREVLTELWLGLLPDDQVQKPPEYCLPLITTLREQNYLKSASVLWQLAVPCAKEQPLDRWVKAAPTAECVEALRKVAGISKPNFIQLLRAPGLPLLQTAGAEWLLVHGRPEDIRVVVTLLLEERPRPPSLKAPAELLRKFLANDSKGKKIPLVLGATAHDQLKLQRVVALARQPIMDGWPVVVQRDSSGLPLREIVRALFPPETSATKNSVRIRGGELAMLAGRLLLTGRTSPEMEAVLEELGQIGRELRLTNPESALWTLESAETRAMAPGPRVSLESAKQWAMIYERASRDSQPLGYLETLGHNLGLKEFETPGTQTAYSPQLHADSEGGMLPGDRATVISSGWMLDQFVIVRARIRPT